MIRQIRNIAMQVVKVKDPKKMEQFLTDIYLLGMADGANAEVVKGDDRYLKLEIGRKYECVCPICGSEIELDLLGLLEDEEEKAK